MGVTMQVYVFDCTVYFSSTDPAGQAEFDFELESENVTVILYGYSLVGFGFCEVKILRRCGSLHFEATPYDQLAILGNKRRHLPKRYLNSSTVCQCNFGH